MPLNIGKDFREKHGWDQLHYKRVVRIQGKDLPLAAWKGKQDCPDELVGSVYVASRTVIHAESARQLPLVRQCEKGECLLVKEFWQLCAACKRPRRKQMRPAWGRWAKMA